MPASMLREAILRSHAAVLLALCLNLIVQTFSRWPNQVGAHFSQAPSTHTLHTGFTVILCVRQVVANAVMIDVEAYRLEFSFPDLQTHRPLVYYSPRQILAPGYVRQTLEESLKEELAAWILEKSRVNSLMREHVKNLQRKMRLLICALPNNAFILHLPPNTSVGPSVEAVFGSSRVSVVDLDTMKITITTNDGYSISHQCSRTSVPLPVALRTDLLRPYLGAN